MSGLLPRLRGFDPRSRAVPTTATAAEYLLPVPYERWAILARDELTQPSPPVPRTTRLRLYRHGFRARAAHLYDFETYGFEDYLSDAARYVGAYYINGAWRDAVDNKLLCHLLLSEFDDHLPRVYGILKRGRLHTIDAAELPRSDGGGVGRLMGRPDGPPSSIPDGASWFVDLLQAEKRLVCKRFTGGSGKQVLVCTFDGEDYRVNAEPCTEEELRARIDGLEDYLVTEYVEQAPYAATVFPGSVNTMRVLTMYDETAGEAFVPIATHRFGTDRSGALDNFSRGGLSVGVDRESGTLGPGVQYLPPNHPAEFEAHPDTGEAIAGIEVPGWAAIERKLVEIAERLSYVPYIGWDIVVTDEGEFTIIEANNNTSAAIQIHEPLLRHDRAWRFYADHGVI